MRETVLEAVLRSADAPSEVQRNRFAAFLKKQYGQEVPLRWEQDPALEKGFRMEVGADRMTGVWRAVCGSSGSGWSS